MTLREDQIRRYARHILLPEVGGVGQERLLAAAIEVEVRDGDGAAICALAYLAAAGVGALVLGGDPRGPVSPADVASGPLYRASDLGRARADALRARIAELNPDVTVTELTARPTVRLPLGARPAGESLDRALARGGAAAAAALVQVAAAAPGAAP